MFNLQAFNQLKTKQDFDRMREAFAAQRAQNKQASDLNKLKMMQAQKELMAPEQVKLKQLAEQALLKRNQGMQITPQEEAAIQTMGQIAPPTITTDALGRTIAQPSGWSNVLNQRPSQVAAMPPSAMGQRADSGMVSPTTQQVPNTGDFVDVASQPDLPPVQGSPMVDPTAQPFQATGMLAGTPAGEIMENEIRAYAAKKNIDMQTARNELIQEKQTEKESARPKAEQSFKSLMTDATNIIKRVDDAIELVSPYTAGFGSYTKNIAGTPARNLDSALKTIQADAAFSRLQDMRDASKTGGALGQVSERELALLQNARIALDQEQDAQTLIKNLNEYKDIRTKALRNVAEAYKQDYGVYPSGFEDFMSGKGKTRLRYNPQTGMLE